MNLLDTSQSMYLNIFKILTTNKLELFSRPRHLGLTKNNINLRYSFFKLKQFYQFRFNFVLIQFMITYL
jgi:hypothetical protein